MCVWGGVIIKERWYLSTLYMFSASPRNLMPLKEIPLVLCDTMCLCVRLVFSISALNLFTKPYAEYVLKKVRDYVLYNFRTKHSLRYIPNCLYLYLGSFLSHTARKCETFFSCPYYIGSPRTNFDRSLFHSYLLL